MTKEVQGCPICKFDHHVEKYLDFYSRKDKKNKTCFFCTECNFYFFDRNSLIFNQYVEDNLAASHPKPRHYLFKKIINKLSYQVESPKLLEIGAGNLHLARMLPDINKTLVDCHKPKIIPKNSTFVLGGLQKVDKFPHGGFDVIVIDNVLEHVEDFTNLIDLCKERLKSTGYIVISVPNKNNIKHIFNKNAEFKHPDEHINIFSDGSLDLCLKRSGFKIKNCYFIPKNIFEFTAFFSFIGISIFGVYRVYSKD